VASVTGHVTFYLFVTKVTALITFSLMMIMSMDETASLKCGHQLAYCSSLGDNMGTENNDGTIERGKTDSSNRALWQSYQQSHQVAKQDELAKQMINLVL
jgi:hypothetical protein